MISLKYTKEERAEEKREITEGMSAPDYPYGLCLYLEKETLKKLGLEPMDVGSEVKFTAKAYVKSQSQHESEESKEVSMSLQITEMEINSAHDSDTAKRFYGDGEE